MRINDDDSNLRVRLDTIALHIVRSDYGLALCGRKMNTNLCIALNPDKDYKWHTVCTVYTREKFSTNGSPFIQSRALYRRFFSHVLYKRYHIIAISYLYFVFDRVACVAIANSRRNEFLSLSKLGCTLTDRFKHPRHFSVHF